ncbi:hypothetical protein Pst134EB_030060 [Puccinia striiformis f. sp. tritici]|nr:hypothetical protein Pst134EB_030060 [Puccinia striiformis f. sp. tritici]
MRMASEAARDLEIIASFSAPDSTGKTVPRNVPLYQHPNAHHQASDAMEVNAAIYSHFRPPTPFEALFKRVCLAQRRNMSNVPFRHSSRRLGGIVWSSPPYESIMQPRDPFVNEPPLPPPTPPPPAPVPFQWSPNGPFSHPAVFARSSAPPVAQPAIQGYDEVYDNLLEAELATVKVRLDTSRAGRIMVPVSLQVSPTRSVLASVLVDTGAMANFINKKFVEDHQLSTRLRKTPIRCVGFDGNKGVGGMVTHDWAGRIHLASVNTSTSVPFPGSFGVTCLGSVDAMFGLPWLDHQTWKASGSSSGGHRFTLGTSEFLWWMLTPWGTSWKDNCTLPPHRSMDISIKLRDGAVPPFGGLCQPSSKFEMITQS